MSDFSCPVVRVAAVRPIPEADEIEHATVFGCEIIVPRHRYAVGDLAIYVPSDAVLPLDLAASLKGISKLFGSQRNRTRPFALRGALSEGILIGPLPCGTVGQDAGAALGITKYEPPVPKEWRGDCIYLPSLTVAYDIRSARRYHQIMREGEEVELTEKIHGTFCAIGYMPALANDNLLGGDTLVYSKGLGMTGHALKADNDQNLYLRTAVDLMLRDRLRAAFNNRPATIFGEIYGADIQDLGYGKSTPTFALFDIYLGLPGAGHWLDRDQLAHISGEIAPTVPTLYRGPLEQNIVRELASTPTLAGRGLHLSEGVVIRPMRDRQDRRIGRAILKYVSPEYLTRTNGTEFQ
jgi:RNA ligase (TIGR02306 family)